MIFSEMQDGFRWHAGKAIINLESYSEKLIFISAFFHSLWVHQRGRIAMLLMCLQHTFNTCCYNQDRVVLSLKALCLSMTEIGIFSFKNLVTVYLRSGDKTAFCSLLCLSFPLNMFTI